MHPEMSEPVSKQRSGRGWIVSGCCILSLSLAGSGVFYGYVLLTADATLRRTEKLLALDQPDEAFQNLYLLARFDSQDASTNLLMGRIKLQQKNYSEAILHFERVSEHAPEYETALHNLAGCLLNDNQLEKAEAVLRKLVQTSPGSLPAHRELSVLLLGQLRRNEAVPVLLNYLRREIDSPPADRLAVLRDLLTAQFLAPVPEGCLESLQVASSQHPGQLPVLIALTECFWKTGRQAEAESLIQLLQSQTPTSLRVDLLELRLRISQRELSAAESLIRSIESAADSDLREAAHVDPDFQILKGEVQELSEDYSAAVRSLEYAASLRPLDRSSRARYARLLQRTGQSSKARELNAQVHRQAEAELALWHLAGKVRDQLPTSDECVKISELFTVLEQMDQATAWHRMAVDVGLLNQESADFPRRMSP